VSMNIVGGITLKSVITLLVKAGAVISSSLLYISNPLTPFSPLVAEKVN
jgi:hypothetical protein